VIQAPDRKLAVLLHADIAGSTSLVQVNESLAHERIQNTFHNLSKCIVSYGGIAHEIRGDALIAEFGRASDAVSASLTFQASNSTTNEMQPDDIHPKVRIGIAIGEVVIADGTITGEGIVMAQRLEQTAIPGGVVIQGAAYETVPKRLPFDFKSLGEIDLKGFDAQVRAFTVNLQPGANIPSIEPREHTTFLRANSNDKPSIAVLPFKNMSGDPDQEYFTDGISEDIITGLSKFHWFFVIARNSSFSYKGSQADTWQISKELDVKYVLEGSVRKVGNRVRISAQLMDAAAGHHVWAERYDRELDDIFAVQDEISEAITTTVAPAFISAEERRVVRKTPESFDAWDFAIRGNWHLSRGSKDDLSEAMQLFDEALKLDPKCTTALSGLAFALCWVNIFGWADDLEEIWSKAYKMANLAISYDENDAMAHAIMGWVRFSRQDLDGAISECSRALDLNPNLALAESIYSISSSWRGDNAEAMNHAQKAEKLSPRDPAQSMWCFARSSAEFGMGNYEQAAKWAKLATDVMPEFPGAWRYLASSLAHLGRLDEAQAATHELLNVLPHDNLSMVRDGLPSTHQSRMERFVEGLRKAGLPE